MNPIRVLKILSRASTLFGLLERGSKDWDNRKLEGDVSKSLFKSKTFWFNVLSAAAELSGVLPLPAGVSTLVVNVVNIGLRLLTETPVHVAPKS